jgi:hypothetical protein
LNLRPLPCQQDPGNRCARRRSPRSPPTVDAEGKRSLDVKGNALFHLLPTVGHHYLTRLAAAMQRHVGGDASTPVVPPGSRSTSPTGPHPLSWLSQQTRAARASHAVATAQVDTSAKDRCRSKSALCCGIQEAARRTTCEPAPAMTSRPGPLGLRRSARQKRRRARSRRARTTPRSYCLTLAARPGPAWSGRGRASAAIARIPLPRPTRVHGNGRPAARAAGARHAATAGSPCRSGCG